MYIAKDVLGKLFDVKDARDGEKYFCKFCNEELNIKCRNSIKKQMHFAHKRNSDCVEQWAQKDMSEWHKNWQSYFPIESREVIVEYEGIKHIADVLHGGTVFEFQHSPISYENFTNRNNFYSALGYKVVWVFDEIDRVKQEDGANRYFFNYVQNQFENFDSKKGNIEIFFEIERNNEKELLILYKDLTPNSFRIYTTDKSLTIQDFLRTYKLIEDGDIWTVGLIKMYSREWRYDYNEWLKYEEKKRKEIERRERMNIVVINNQIPRYRTAPIDYELMGNNRRRKRHPINNRRNVRF